MVACGLRVCTPVGNALLKRFSASMYRPRRLAPTLNTFSSRRSNTFCSLQSVSDEAPDGYEHPVRRLPRGSRFKSRLPVQLVLHVDLGIPGPQLNIVGETRAKGVH